LWDAFSASSIVPILFFHEYIIFSLFLPKNKAQTMHESLCARSFVLIAPFVRGQHEVSVFSTHFLITHGGKKNPEKQD